MSELKYYEIEFAIQRDGYIMKRGLFGNKVAKKGKPYWAYRYYSLYNGTCGAWYANRDNAVEEGEAHRALIILSLGIID